jgi:putative hydrolase of the HAD superfamily
LIFDLDDTLIPTGRFYDRAMALAGVDAASLAAARKKTKGRLADGHVVARNRLLYLKAMSEAGSGFCSSEVLDTMHRYEDALVTMCRESWRALGRGPMFANLSEHFKIALVTNENTRTQLLKLSAFAPDDRYFPVVVTSEEMGIEKPSPQIFQEALQRLGLAAGQCVMIGDDPRADLFPARDLGMRAVWTTEFFSTMAGQRASSWDGDSIAFLGDLPAWLEAL